MNDAAAEFIRSLRAAAHTRPVQAAQAPDSDTVGQAIWRSGAGHWVNSLPLAADSSIEPAEASPCQIRPSTRTSELTAMPPARASALSILRTLASVRVSGTDAAGRIWSSRVAPSAGGTHSIRPLLFIAETPDHGSWFRIDDDRVAQVDVRQGAPLVADIADALRAPVLAAVVAVAEPDVLLARYPEGVSLLWRDAGAFCATTQFVADSFSLRSRIIGISHELDATHRQVPAFAVGAVALSGREEDV